MLVLGELFLAYALLSTALFGLLAVLMRSKKARKA